MRVLLGILQLMILLAMGWAFVHGPMQAPVMSVAARSQTVSGQGWHIGTVHTAYVTTDYRLAQVREWLEHGLTHPDAGVRLEAVAQARRHAERAIAVAPTNAYAWAALGWAENLAGNGPAAIAAVERSRKWAPIATNVALDRVLILQRFWLDLDDAARNAVLDDLTVAATAYGTRFRDAVDGNAFLALLWRLAQERMTEGR